MPSTCGKYGMKDDTKRSHIEFTGETKVLDDGTVLGRIRATEDLPHHGVKAGDVGGWVQSLENITEKAWVAGEAMVYDNAVISGRALVSGHARVNGWAKVYGESKVTGGAGAGTEGEAGRCGGNLRSDRPEHIAEQKASRDDELSTGSKELSTRQSDLSTYPQAPSMCPSLSPRYTEATAVVH